jgi:hypothetical protein
VGVVLLVTIGAIAFHDRQGEPARRSTEA